ncbi:hypothetical protein P7K49_024377, partial [Saguinus oedipus]
ERGLGTTVPGGRERRQAAAAALGSRARPRTSSPRSPLASSFPTRPRVPPHSPAQVHSNNPSAQLPQPLPRTPSPPPPPGAALYRPLRCPLGAPGQGRARCSFPRLRRRARRRRRSLTALRLSLPRVWRSSNNGTPAFTFWR